MTADPVPKWPADTNQRDASLIERCRRDPAFKRIVDDVAGLLHDIGGKVGELRDAVDCAAALRSATIAEDVLASGERFTIDLDDARGVRQCRMCIHWKAGSLKGKHAVGICGVDDASTPAEFDADIDGCDYFERWPEAIDIEDPFAGKLRAAEARLMRKVCGTCSHWQRQGTRDDGKGIGLCGKRGTKTPSDANCDDWQP